VIHTSAPAAITPENPIRRSKSDHPTDGRLCFVGPGFQPAAGLPPGAEFAIAPPANIANPCHPHSLPRSNRPATLRLSNCPCYLATDEKHLAQDRIGFVCSVPPESPVSACGKMKFCQTNRNYILYKPTPNWYD
jgi:hypothetical protein